MKRIWLILLPAMLLLTALLYACTQAPQPTPSHAATGATVGGRGLSRDIATSTPTLVPGLECVAYLKVFEAQVLGDGPTGNCTPDPYMTPVPFYGSYVFSRTQRVPVPTEDAVTYANSGGGIIYLCAQTGFTSASLQLYDRAYTQGGSGGIQSWGFVPTTPRPPETVNDPAYTETYCPDEIPLTPDPYWAELGLTTGPYTVTFAVTNTYGMAENTTSFGSSDPLCPGPDPRAQTKFTLDVVSCGATVTPTVTTVLTSTPTPTSTATPTCVPGATRTVITPGPTITTGPSPTPRATPEVCQ